MMVVQPEEGAVIRLKALPGRSDPVALRAYLSDGDRDVTADAHFNWVLSWHGTYHTYLRLLAKSPATSVEFETGGELLRVFASYGGGNYEGRVRISVVGDNPSRRQVATKIEPDHVLGALSWLESGQTWHHFDHAGSPVQPRIGRKLGSARGIAQVLERWWARTTEIEHNDYPRTAWQWDYCLDAARDILCYLERKARKRFPTADAIRIQSYVLKAYNLGEGCFRVAADPDKFPYVALLRKSMAERPRER